jgi:hypothetical protein
LKFKFHGSAGTGYEAVGKRVRVQRVFPKKNVTGPSQTRTGVPVYPSIPGHGYGFRGYGLYPAGFSKPLPETNAGSHWMQIRRSESKVLSHPKINSSKILLLEVYGDQAELKQLSSSSAKQNGSDFSPVSSSDHSASIF